MNQRFPLKKMSEKQKAKLLSLGQLQHNSTFRRKPCNAMNVEQRSKRKRFITVERDFSSVSRTPIVSNETFTLDRHALRPSKESFGKQRKPVKKQSGKQKDRLRRLAAIRLRWWKDSKASGQPLICGICYEEILHFEDLASDHIEPGSAKSDHESNLQPANKLCNFLKGSKRNFKILPGTHDWDLIHGLL
jgi:hypothetical protein